MYIKNTKFEGVFLTLFCFHFRAKQPEVDMPGPRRDRCVSKFVLHWTMLIKDFSVFNLLSQAVEKTMQVVIFFSLQKKAAVTSDPTV